MSSDTTKEVHQPGAGIRNFYDLSPTDEEREAKILVACRKYLQMRGLSAEYVQHAIDEGWIMAWDGARQARIREKEKEYRITGKYPGVPTFAVPGMAVCYQPCLDERTRVRVRYFAKTIENEEGEEIKVPRWVASAGDTVPWLRAIPEAGWTDPRVPIVIVEAPTKAMALAQYGVAALGLGGADAGLHDPEHPERMNAEAARIVWRGRLVYILSDAGQVKNPQVAHGVGRMAHLLSQAGADVRVCYLPEKVPTKDFQDPKSYDQGPDDYLAGVYQDAHDRLAGRAAMDKDEERSKKREDRVEAVARRVARLALSRLLREAHPWQPWELVKALRTAKAELEPLLEDLPFLACLQHSGETGLARTAHAWGRGGKGLLQGALKGVREEFAKASEDQSPYKVVDGKLCYGDQELASFRASITESVTRDDGLSTSSVFRISGALSTGANLPTIEVPSEEYAKMEWPHMWGPKAYLTAGKGVRDHARVAIQELSTPTSRHVYTATGWRDIAGKHVYMLPGGGIGPDGHVDAECDVSGRYARPELPESNEEALNAVMWSLLALNLADSSVTAPLLAMAYTAPLRPLLPHGLDFTLWVYGQTGSMKSSLAGVVQSHFGDYSHTDLPGSWFSTANQIELKLTKAADVLFTIDNLVPPKTGRDLQEMTSKVNRITQTIGDQQSRGRLDRNAEERAGRPPRAGVVSTAEMLPPADNESTFGRIFAVRLEKGSVDTALLTRLQSVEGRHFLQKSMAGYIRWLAQQDWDALRTRIASMLVEARDKVIATYAGGSLHPRHPTMVAILHVGLTLFREYAATVGLPADARRWVPAREGLELALRDQPQPVAATAVDEWLGALRSMLSTRMVALADGGAFASMEPRFEEGRHIPVVGRIVGEEVWLDPVASYQAVERFLGASWRYNRSELQRQLLDATVEVEGQGEVTILAAIERDKTRRRAILKRAVGPGVSERVLVLRRMVLGLPGGLRVVETANADGTSEVDIDGDEDLTGQG